MIKEYLVKRRTAKALATIQQEVDARLETLFESMRTLYPEEPYVKRGEWSWCLGYDIPRRLDLMFHYFPVSFIILSPLDTDMDYCCELLGKEAWFERQSVLEKLRARAKEAKCLLILASPEDTLSTEWVTNVLEGHKPMLIR